MPHSGRHRVDESLAALVAAGETFVAAAKTVGISESTARRRMKQPAFSCRVTELRSEMVRQAAGRLADVMGRATDKLAELLDHKDPNVAARSANALLSHAVSVVKLADLDARLRALEIAAGANPAEVLTRES